MVDDWPLLIARFAQTLGGVSLVGTLGFAALVTPLPNRALIGSSLALVWLGALAWVAQASAQFGVTPASLLLDTGIGNLLLIRLALLSAAGWVALARPRWVWLAGLLAGLGVALVALSSHAAALGDHRGIAFLAFHMLAAGIWLGGLVPLWQAGPPSARRFGNLAALAVAGLAVTAMAQGLVLIGDLAGLFGTHHGRAALVKFGLFITMLAVAGLNRWVLRPRWLRIGIAAELLLGLGIVAAATLMALSPPAVHSVPVWPFPWSISFDVMAEPELGDEVYAALHALLGAFALVLLAVLARRVRWLALAAAAAIVLFAVPHFDLLLVPAVPTSFQRSPTLFAATAIAAAMPLYSTHCASCHGAGGQGDGPDAAKQSIPPADLTAGHLWDHPDGVLFWMIQSGSRTAIDTVGMPGLGDQLSRDQIWTLIDLIRARNAAVSAEPSGVFTVPIAAPALMLDCADQSIGTLAELISLRGAVLIMRGAPAPGTIPTVYLHSGPPPIGMCVAPDQAAWAGYAVLADEVTLPDGAWFTTDANGWLRQRGTGPAETAWQKSRAAPLTLTDHPHSH